MKSILYVLLLLISNFPLYSQNKVAVVSVFGTKMDEPPDINSTKLLDFIDQENLHNRAIQRRFGDIVDKLNSMLTILPMDYLDQSFYKYLLEEYENAPENIEITKQDYRMSEFQVVYFEKFLAIGIVNPFNNKEAIKNLFDELPDASAFMFLEFYPSVSFVGSSYGVGTSSAYFTMHIKIINRQLETILKVNISGSSASKFNVNGKDFNSEEIGNSFDEALETLLSKIEKKISKKVEKIKW